MTDQEKQDLLTSLGQLRDEIEVAPPEFDTDLKLAAHFYGLLMKVAPVIDETIRLVSK